MIQISTIRHPVTGQPMAFRGLMLREHTKVLRWVPAWGTVNLTPDFREWVDERSIKIERVGLVAMSIEFTDADTAFEFQMRWA